MNKIKLGPQTIIYPMPAFLIGAMVEGKPNFMTAAWSGIAASNPPAMTVALQHHRHTLKGLKENGTFSVNVPSVDQAKETDYCGIVSGTKTDKAKDCKFTIFYGKLETAPLIEQCPVNLECRVAHLLHLGSHALIIGHIEEVHVSENCLTNGEPDPSKINPLIFAVGSTKSYFALGAPVAAAFKVGLEIKKAGS